MCCGLASCVQSVASFHNFEMTDHNPCLSRGFDERAASELMRRSLWSVGTACAGYSLIGRPGYALQAILLDGFLSKIALICEAISPNPAYSTLWTKSGKTVEILLL